MCVQLAPFCNEVEGNNDIIFLLIGQRGPFLEEHSVRADL